VSVSDFLDLTTVTGFTELGSGATPYTKWDGLELFIVSPGGLNIITPQGLLINGSPLSADISFPATAFTDMSFRPNNVANNALDLVNNVGAVNGIRISGTATTVSPLISAVGADTNIAITLAPKGSGGVIGPFLDAGGALYNAKAYGVKVDGVTDDAAALQTLATAIAAASGGVLFVPGGVCILHSNVTIPQTVSLQGAGSDSNTPATRFKCTAAGAGLTFTGSGGTIRGFLIDGNSIATLPFTRNTGTAQTVFEDVAVGGSAQDNIYLGQTQNDVFLSCRVQNAVRDNLYMDNGAGGTRFYGCEFATPGRYNLHFDALITGGGAPANVDDVTFNHAIIEGAGFTAGAYVSGAANVVFRDTEFACGLMSDATIHINSGAVVVGGGHMTAGNTDTAVKIDTGGFLLVTDYPTWTGFGTGINFTGAGGGVVVGSINWNGVTNRYNSVNTADVQFSMPMGNPIHFVREGTGNPIVQSDTFNGSGRYFTLAANGQMTWGDGTTYGSDLSMERDGAGTLALNGSLYVSDSTSTSGSILFAEASANNAGALLRLRQDTTGFFGNAIFLDMGNNGGSLVGGNLINATTGGALIFKFDYLGNLVSTATAAFTTASATALTVAAAGTNYGLQVDESTASAVTGLKIKAGASGGGLALSVINGAAAESLTIDAKGAGGITIGGTSTGDVTIGGTGVLNFGYASQVVSGASPAVIGSITGGPATNAQYGWRKVKSTTTTEWIPVWR
jgi:hypothetical protein